jgi:VIT1/CCC1 family predicted Fe2+/Mn2+ transporter
MTSNPEDMEMVNTTMEKVEVAIDSNDTAKEEDQQKDHSTAVRDAFKSGDVEASKNAHAKKSSEMSDALLGNVEKHGGSASEYLKSIVFGGLDGIITTFAIVAASAGGGVGTDFVLMMGFANLIADGISMGFGDFLSTKAELDFAKLEMKREEWECDNNLDGEIQEMVDIYKEKGMTHDEATQVISVFSKHRKLFVDLMMVEELGIMPPDPDDSPAKAGLVTMLSFFAFGSIPLWFYTGFHAAGWTDKTAMFAIACASTGVAIFSLGFFKAFFTHQNKMMSGLGMLLNGTFAAAAAYLIGFAFEEGMGISMDGCGGK